MLLLTGLFVDFIISFFKNPSGVLSRADFCQNQYTVVHKIKDFLFLFSNLLFFFLFSFIFYFACPILLSIFLSFNFYFFVPFYAPFFFLLYNIFCGEKFLFFFSRSPFCNSALFLSNISFCSSQRVAVDIFLFLFRSLFSYTRCLRMFFFFPESSGFFDIFLFLFVILIPTGNRTDKP